MTGVVPDKFDSEFHVAASKELLLLPVEYQNAASAAGAHRNNPIASVATTVTILGFRIVSLLLASSLNSKTVRRLWRNQICSVKGKEGETILPIRSPASSFAAE